ncbi:MAG TPA: sulfotransferase [Xanthobacteraceae bacterium]
MRPLIDVDRLWRVAEQRVGRPLPRSADIHVEGWRCLASAMESGNGYDAAGMRLLRRDIFAWSLAYLKFAADRTLYTDIADVPISRPIFIVGFGRTGSTLLHNLLALDAGARAPLLWELWAPSPPPRPDNYASDSRIEAAQARLDLLARAAPLIPQIHPMRAQAPDECHWMMRHTTLNVMLYRVPQYWAWLKRLSVAELHELYAHYKLQVQHLQLFHRGNHWVSKAFTHLHYLPVLFDVFPDAKVVRLHRHPCRAVPSLCSLAASYRGIYSDRVDREEIGQTMFDVFLDGMERSRDIDRRVGPQHFIDVQYAELVRDPIAVVRRIYRQFGYPYSAAFEEQLLRFTVNEAGAARPRHVYRLEQFGLSQAVVTDRSKEYLAWVKQRGEELADI